MTSVWALTLILSEIICTISYSKVVHCRKCIWRKSQLRTPVCHASASGTRPVEASFWRCHTLWLAPSEFYCVGLLPHLFVCIRLAYLIIVLILSQAVLDPEVEARVNGIILTSPAVRIQPQHPVVAVCCLSKFRTTFSETHCVCDLWKPGVWLKLTSSCLRLP
jgi:hypothetical protein